MKLTDEPTFTIAQAVRSAAQKWLFVLLSSATVLFPCLAVAAAAEAAGDVPASEAALQTGRNWTITIPLWVPGYRGEFAIGDVDVDGESSGGSGFLQRLFDNKLSLNFFFMGAVAWERNRWRAHADVFGGKFTDDVIFKLTDGTVASASVQPIISNLHVDYRVWKYPWGDSGYQQLRLWLYGGVRDYDVRAEVNLGQKNETLDSNWADPIVGVWVPVDVSRRWFLEVASDVGGFDVGSRFSWQILGAVSYRATELLTFTLGYNILDVDFRDTVASQRVLYHVRIGGPLAGVRFNF